MNFIQLAGQKNLILPLSAFGDLRTIELSPIFQASFEYTVDNTELNTNIVVNGGTVVQASGMAVISTSATVNSSACLESTRHARYRSGLGALVRFTALFTAGVANTEQYIGCLDETGSSAAFKNGLAVGFDGDTFGFHRFVNDTKVSVVQSSWDDPLDGTGASGSTLDPTKLNVWYISFQYLGAGAINLHFEKPNGEVVIVHTIQYSGANIVPSSFNPNYHFIIWVNNKSAASDLILKSSSFAYFVEGKTGLTELHQPQQSTGEKSKTSVTSEVAILTIKNKASYASKTNFIDLILEQVACSIEAASANNLGNIRLVRNATLGGTPSFTDINTSDSVVGIDTAGTTVTGGKELISFPLSGKNDGKTVLLVPFKLIIAPGEQITISGSSTNSATVKGSLLWKELF